MRLLGRRAGTVNTFCLVLGWILVVWSIVEAHRLPELLRARVELVPLVPLLPVPLLLMILAVGLPGAFRMAADTRYLLMIHSGGAAPARVTACWLVELALRALPWSAILASFCLGVAGETVTWAIAARAATFAVLTGLWVAGLQLLGVLAVRTLSATTLGFVVGALLILLILPLHPVSTATPGGVERLLSLVDGSVLTWLCGATALVQLGTGELNDMRGPANPALCFVTAAGLSLALSTWRWQALLKPPPNTLSRILDPLLWPARLLVRRAGVEWAVQTGLELLRMLRGVNINTAVCLLAGTAVLAFNESLHTPLAGLGVLVGFACGMIIGSDGTEETLTSRHPFRLERMCGADPLAYAVGLPLATALIAALVATVACLGGIEKDAISASIARCVQAAVLGGAEALMACMIAISLHPVLPRLGIFGKIERGAFVAGMAALVLILSRPGVLIAAAAVAVFLMLHRRKLGRTVQRRIWDDCSL